MTKIRLLIAMLLTVSLVGGYALIVFGQNFHVHDTLHTSHGPDKVVGEIVVKFKPGTTEAAMAALHARHGVTELATSRFSGVKRLKISPRKTIEDMVAIYRRNPNVEYAEPNFIAHALWSPNDPHYAPYQWHLDNTEHGGIEMEAAWSITTGRPDIIVAVIDSGVAYEDYDQYVARNKRTGYWINYLRAPDLAQTAFVAGYDFINNDAHPNDDEGHGTHVTGTIAQSTNNALGTAGIAFNSAIMPVKVLDSSGSGSYTAIADGIYFAANNGARVINMSLGGSSPSITLENALAYAYNRGVTIICASGNDGSATTISYPAAYDAYCIAVGATRYDETVTGYSNQGASLDLSAPGGDIGQDQNGDGYGDGVLQQTFGSSPTDFGYYFYQGTSMATPHVTGVAALLLAQDDSRSPDDIRHILQSSAKDGGTAGWDAGYGWGIVDAAAALGYTPVPNSVPVAKLQVTAPEGQIEDKAILVDGSGSFDPDGDNLTYRWSFGDGTTAAGTTASHSYAAGGNYEIQLIVNDSRVDSEPVTTAIAITEVNDPPVAAAGADLSATVNQDVIFDGGDSYDIDDGIADHTWDFGDDTTATGQIVSHDYTSAGDYTATLTVTDHGGLSSSDQLTVTITQTPQLNLLTSDIGLALISRQAGKNLFVKALATVRLNDLFGPVADVIVSGVWNDDSALLSAVTDPNGQIQLESAEIKNPTGGTTFSFSIRETIKAGYDTTPSGETSDSIQY